MYELRIKDKQGIWRIADLGDDNPAMNYSANDLAELKDRNVNYSQAVNLPISPTNSSIFECVDIFDVHSDIPYIRLDCRLYANGCVLAGKGAFIKLRKVTKFFECQIIGGNVDLFELLKNSKVSDLELGFITKDLNSLQPNNFTQAYEFALATFIKGGANQLRTNIDNLHPFIKLKYVIETMMQTHGFSIKHNLLNRWENHVISLSSLKSQEDSLTELYVEAYGKSRIANSSAIYFPFTVTRDLYGWTDRIGNDVSTEWRCLYYIAPANCTIKASMRIQVAPAQSGATMVNQNNIVAGVTNLNTGEALQDLGYGQTNIYTMTVSKGDKLEFFLHKKAQTVGTLIYDYDIKIEIVESSSVPVGGKLYFAPNIGFDNQLDLFKAFAQLFGLTINVDNNNKIVHAYTMDMIYNNKKKSRDWSGKLHKSNSRELSFEISPYAQQNNILFNDNSDDDVIDKGHFKVQNENLALSKDLFTISFEAGLDKIFQIDRVNHLIANIPLEELSVNDNGLSTITFKGGKPHILELSEEKVKISLNETTKVDYKVAKHSKVQSFIDGFYPSLLNLLDNAKISKEWLYLTDQDIEEFDQFTPVYIDYFGAYFYVNKINNYISGRLTECELIRL